MALKDVFKVNRKTFFNPSAWLGVDQLKTGTSVIWNILKDLITPDKPEFTETFTEAMHRLNVTEAEVQQKGQMYFTYAMIFLLLGVGSFIVGLYYLFHHHTFAGCLLAIAVTALFATQAFRFHFWYFQIKHRKLGCTFDEWLKGKPQKEPKA